MCDPMCDNQKSVYSLKRRVEKNLRDGHDMPVFVKEAIIRWCDEVDRKTKADQKVFFNASLEAAITAAGRDAVFERAKQLGLVEGNTPPEWVWWGIVREVADRHRPPQFNDFNLGRSTARL